jgi:thioredoxin-related protein
MLKLRQGLQLEEDNCYYCNICQKVSISMEVVRDILMESDEFVLPVKLNSFENRTRHVKHSDPF